MHYLRYGCLCRLLFLCRERVRAMFYHGYENYLNNAFPYDELRPLTCDGVDSWGRLVFLMAIERRKCWCVRWSFKMLGHINRYSKQTKGNFTIVIYSALKNKSWLQFAFRLFQINSSLVKKSLSQCLFKSQMIVSFPKTMDAIWRL